MIFIVVVLSLLIVTGVKILFAVSRLHNWCVYVIKKSKHFSSFTWTRLLLTTDSYIAFNVIFITGSDYDLHNDDQDDINKLYGLGYGLRGPSYNSYRIGWRWNAKIDRVELFLFVQERGSMWYRYLGKTPIDEQITIRMIIESGILTAYLYQDKQETVSIQYVFTNKIGMLKYRCFPYFGGNQVAPHDVKILIKEIV